MTEIGDNSKPARAEIIRSIKAELDEIDGEKALLSLRAKKAKGRIKAELGEKVADFNVLLRFADLEDDPRSELSRLLREGLQALGVGETMNFLDVIDPVPAPKPKKGKKTKAEEIAEAVLGDAGDFVDSDGNIQIEAADDHQPDPTQTDIEDFVESEEPLGAA